MSVLSIFIGLVGFEPTTSWSRTRRDTKLRYSPFLEGKTLEKSVSNKNASTGLFTAIVETVETHGEPNYEPKPRKRKPKEKTEKGLRKIGAPGRMPLGFGVAWD